MSEPTRERFRLLVDNQWLLIDLQVQILLTTPFNNISILHASRKESHILKLVA
jgi:hypothetical protein